MTVTQQKYFNAKAEIDRAYKVLDDNIWTARLNFHQSTMPYVQCMSDLESQLTKIAVKLAIDSGQCPNQPVVPYRSIIDNVGIMIIWDGNPPVTFSLTWDTIESELLLVTLAS